MKKIFLTLIFTAFAIAMQAQQDPQFSHNMFNLVGSNPGFAGMTGQINAVLINRQQWMKFEGAPVTTLLTLDAPVKFLGQNSGVGISLLDDRLGPLKNFGFKGYYSYHYMLGAGTLGTGIGLGLYNQSMSGDWIFPEIDEPLVVPDSARGMTLDLDAGAFYTLENLYIGISATHLHQPRLKYTKGGEINLKRHYFLTGGYNIQLANALIDLTPSIFLKTDGSSFQFDFNVNLLYNKKFWGGVTYRNKEALILLAGTSIFNDVKIGIAYDVNLTKIRNDSFEVFVGYQFMLEIDKPVQKYRSVRFL